MLENQNSLRVLITDDEDIVRHVMSLHLMRMGHQVDEVSDGEQAFEAIASNNYDLAFLDYRMPQYDGLEVLRMVREAKIDIAVVILSGHGTEETRDLAKKLGALDFLKKPMKLAVLENLLAEYFSPK